MKTIKDKFSKKISAPEIFVVFMLSIFGMAAIFWLPMGAGYDEETHMVRVWEMSFMDMVPNNVGEPQTLFPAFYWQESYRRHVLVDYQPADFWEKYGELPYDGLDFMYGMKTRSVYSPPLLLPQAIAVRYARGKYDLPALPIYMLARVAGLFSYIFLAWLAVRLIPYGKWLFAILATSPLAVIQSATVSADSISNGIALLFIAGILAIAQAEEIDWKKWGGIILLAFILFWAKVNLLYLILLLALIPPKRYQKKIMFPLLLGILLVLFAVEVVGWSVLAYPRLETPPDGTDPIGQIKYILTHLPTAMSVLVGHAVRTLGERLLGWMAIYGYNYWPVPQVTYWLYGLAVIAMLFIKRDDENLPTKRKRKILGILFMIGYLATIGLMYLSFTPVGASDVNGVQGRYFFVAMPLLFLALFGLKEWKTRPALNIALIFGTLSVVTFSIGGWLSYHVPCGSQYYTGGYCYQPRYKNFFPEGNSSPALTSELTLAQEVVPKCDGMTTLQVRVNQNDAVANERVRFSLTTLDGDIVFDKTLSASEIPADNWQAFDFEPLWDSSQNAYLLTISSSAPKSDLTLAYSIRPEYLDGKLYENGEEIEQDLVFQYGCVAGWEKLLETE